LFAVALGGWSMIESRKREFDDEAMAGST